MLVKIFIPGKSPCPKQRKRYGTVWPPASMALPHTAIPAVNTTCIMTKSLLDNRRGLDNALSDLFERTDKVEHLFDLHSFL